MDRAPPIIAWTPPSLSSEFRLLARCCHANFKSRITPGARPDHQLDWATFLALVTRHRAAGLAWHGLKSLGIEAPQAIAVKLSAAAATTADHGLRAALLSGQLRDAFAARDIPLLFLKGLVVGALAYGDPFRKMAWDIDIFVAPDRLTDACAVLRDMGHRPAHPAGSDDDIVRWHKQSKESIWTSADRRMTVELHTGLSDHAALLPAMGIPAQPTLVEILPGSSLATLPSDEQFAYLCVHGASSAWFRLKWIADLAGTISGASELELGRLLVSAKRLGAGRSAAQALLLACWLFPILAEDAPLARALRSDRVATWLAARSLAQLCGPEPRSRRFGTATIHLTQLMLTPRVGDGLAEFARQLRAPLRRRAFRFDD
ncbi:nucleotidyltransferase domain-containing protein [Sphingomonas sp. RB1R13]|uniref:nucleotidyltransferase domain-containing protein n=1 Tax=Sphingomonas sp. RB1R13 TaxID=3096159 RepID=UPI002FCAEE0C